MNSANLSSVKALPKRSVRQYAFGLMRIDDGDSVTNNSTSRAAPREDEDAVFPWKVIVATANNAPQAQIYLPSFGCLRVDGKNVVVKGLNGQGGRTYYLVTQGELWCAVTTDQETGELSAQIYFKNQIPQDAKHTFPVAIVPANPSKGNITQIACGVIVIGSTSRASAIPGPFDPLYDEQGSLSGFGRGYIQVGGVTVSVGGSTSLTLAEGFVCVSIDCTASSSGSVSNPELIFCTASDLGPRQSDPAKMVVPIFEIAEIDDGGSEPRYDIGMDLRPIPHFQLAEVF